MGFQVGFHEKAEPLRGELPPRKLSLGKRPLQRHALSIALLRSAFSPLRCASRMSRPGAKLSFWERTCACSYGPSRARFLAILFVAGSVLVRRHDQRALFLVQVCFRIVLHVRS